MLQSSPYNYTFDLFNLLPNIVSRNLSSRSPTFVRQKQAYIYYSHHKLFLEANDLTNPTLLLINFISQPIVSILKQLPFKHNKHGLKNPFE